MKEIKLFAKTGSFAENKDLARDLRINKIIPALDKGQNVIINFGGVDAVTQSFVHALVSELIRNYGGSVLDRISFKSCNETVKKIITIVTDYMQESD